MRVRRSSSSNTDIGFNSTCSSAQSSYINVPSGRTGYTAAFRVYGCSASGCTVAAELRHVGSTTMVTSATQRVNVTGPTPTPTRTPRPDDTPTATPTSPPSSSTTTWSTDLESERESGDDEYGYEERDFGDIDDDDFRHDGVNYDIEHLKWDDSSEEIEFEVDRCLKPSEMVSLDIGSRTYTMPDRVRYTDSECEADRYRDQEFEYDEDSNPLRAGRTYRIILTLRTVATPTPTPTNTPVSSTAYLSPNPSTVAFTDNGNQWHRFRVHSSEQIEVIANPGTTPLNVELYTNDPGFSLCPADRTDVCARMGSTSTWQAVVWALARWSCVVHRTTPCCAPTHSASVKLLHPRPRQLAHP